MLPRLLLLLIAGIILVGYGTAQRLPRGKQNLKVRINATGDTIVLKFVRPRPDTKLEGFILGYGSSMFSKQYIQLPENGKPYEAEVDAEPKYLIAVQPIPANDVKKQCTGQVNLQKPLHLIIGSVTQSSVLLSWGTFLKTPFEGNIMNDCLEDGHYTVRYREKERNKKWNYENCPISDTVIDRLKPNTKYEFGVRASKGKQDGLWSKPIVHQTNAGCPDKIKGQIDDPENKIIIDQLRKPQLPDITGLNNRKTITRTRNPPRLVYNRTIDRGPLQPKSPGLASKISFVPSEKHQDTSQPQTSNVPEWPQVTLGKANNFQYTTPSSADVTYSFPHQRPAETLTPSVNPIAFPSVHGERNQEPKPTNAPQRPKIYLANGDAHQGHVLSRPSNATQRPKTYWGRVLPNGERRILPNGEGRVLPNGEGRILPNGEGRVLPNGEGRVLPNGEGRILPNGEGRVLPNGERRVLPNGEGRILPNGEGRVLPNGEGRVLPNGEGRILPNGEGRVLPNGEGRILPKGEGRVLPNGERRVLPNGEGRILPKGEGRVLPNGERRVLPKGEGRILPNGEGRVLPNGEGRVLPKPFNATQRHTHYWANGDGRIPPFNPNQRPKIYWANGEGRILPKSSNTTQRAKIHWGKAYPFKNTTSLSAAVVPHTSPRALPTRNMPSSVKPAAFPSANGETLQGQAQSRPTNTSQRTKSLWAHGDHHKGISQSKSHHVPQWPRIQSANGTQWEDNGRQVHDYYEWPETKLASPLQRSPSDSSRRRQNTVVGKPGNSVKLTDGRQLPDKSSVLRTVLSSVTEKPAKQERKLMTAADIKINATRMEPADNSSVFNPAPLLEIDSMGKERFIAPHVKYMMKEPDDPCSITESLRHFPEEEEALNQDITGPPKHPPSNLTVVTVEGCSSFVILDWQKVDNDSATEYEVISKSRGPAGNEESVMVTNQTHTAVENLKANSSYEFTVQPKNVLGVGPPSEVVPFSTESVCGITYFLGKDAIWTEYPFQSDSYSECNGKQFVKRTWYRKFVGVQLCNSLRYKIYLSDTLAGTFYNIGDQTGHGEDHCQFVDSFLDGRTGQQFPNDQLPQREGFYRAIRQEPVTFGEIGGKAQINYVQWYECGTTIPGKW
ncbi:target of Nesh-SH3-like isoform X1 [Acipenser oxyrinchus oxyrinchus]|uniref:Target of Nesh-SH3-like isoform X1 n=1 Tax=Acipenser oxyrinchus oxyrinchus TaxID=40147 RepID=A0AAD8G7X2_ACIOX|nr:target of Nesh-SH3-like isoform X1 [Acipenser oxyrinchus oxyrinchus]